MTKLAKILERTAIAITMLVSANALAARPAATTQGSADVDIVLTKIDPGAAGITGQLTKQSAATVFEKLSSLANVKFAFAEDSIWDDPQVRDAVFSVNWDREPFWEALAETCDSVGVRIEGGNDVSAASHVRIGRTQCTLPISIDGPVLIRAAGLTRSASVSYWQHQHRPDEIQLSLQLFLEPKLGQAAWIGPPIVETATDDRGHAMATSQPADNPRGGSYKPDGAYHALLLFPAGAGEHIAVVKGFVPMLVVSQMGRITFHHPLDHHGPVSITAGQNKLTLTSITGDGKRGYHCDLELARGKKEPHDRWIATAYPFGTLAAVGAIVGPKGETGGASGNSGLSDQQATCGINFPGRENAEEATDLRVDLPVDFAPLKAKFEFKDLPMP